MGMVGTLTTIVWYTPYGLATMALLMSIAVYAFWRSIGTRTIGDQDERRA